MFSLQSTTRSLAAVATLLANLLVLGAAAPRAHAQGSLVSWGFDHYGQVSGTPAGNFSDVASGFNHMVAIRTNGTLVSWGYDEYGQVSGTPAGTFTAVAAGDLHSVAIRTDGTLASWGYNGSGQVSGTPAGTFTAVAAGSYHSVAIRTDGTLASWGSNPFGEVSGTPAGTFIAVGGGVYHSKAIRTDGTLVSWGYDSDGQVSSTPAGTFIAVAGGHGYHSVAIRTDGTLAAWGYNGVYGHVSAAPAGTFTAVAVTLYHSVAIRTDGTLVSWGLNSDGQVSSTPAGTFTAVAGGLFHSTAIQALDNQAPAANAGPDQTVDENVLVTLDGSASSDLHNDPLTYAWTQLAGPPIVLNTTDPVRPTFVSPTVLWGGSTLTFGLIVNDGEFDSASDTVDITVKNVNHAPVADAGPNQSVAEPGEITLDGSASYDPDNDEFTFSWVQFSGPPAAISGADTAHPTVTLVFGSATLTFQLTVSDGLASHADYVDVVADNFNHDPAADAGTDQTRNEGTAVALDGTASSDPDGDPLTYAWVQIGGPAVTLSNAASPTPAFTAPQVGLLGATLTFQLIVVDGYGGTDDDTVVVTIRDVNAPPACGLARADRPTLWPPNHKFVKINILGVTDPENNPVTITVTGVTQDEPVDAQGNGDGNTSPDALIEDQGATVRVRSERAGNGNGRVYRIHFTADDGLGGVCAGSVTVCVPHDQGHGGGCVDDGLIFHSLIP